MFPRCRFILWKAQKVQADFLLTRWSNPYPMEITPLNLSTDWRQFHTIQTNRLLTHNLITT